MEHRKELLDIELSSLVASPFNVRRHTTGQVEELAALIDAQGLLHNLVVTEQVAGKGKAREVRFAVAAGERRRRALLLLQQRGRLPATYRVPCELVPPERAREVSLAENSGREAMHPADEFEAFKALVDEGRGVEEIAARFGVSVLTVQRRLRLSGLSKRLLTLYREGGINLDQLMALALSDDTATQERAWFDASPWDRTPAALRRVLTAGEVEAVRDAMARFVGVEAYEAAGGPVRRDLFDDAGSRYVCDVELLRRLAAEKLERLAEPVRAEGWAWVETRCEVDSQALRQFTPCAHAMHAPTQQEQAALAELDVRSDELDRESDALAEADEWSADEAERIGLEEEAIAERRKAIRSALRTWAAEVKAHAGAIVTISREGEPDILRGLVREADRKAAAIAQRAATRETVAQEAATAQTAEPKAHECSDGLLRRLAAHRTMALQLTVAANTQVALAALAHALVLPLIDAGLYRARTVMQIGPVVAPPALDAAADDLKAGTAWQRFDTQVESWRARLPAQQDDWLGWLIGLPQQELLELLSLGAAATLNALPAAGCTRAADALARAAGLDMVDWWTPTAVGYLSHVPKALILQTLQEAGVEADTAKLAALKKGDLVTMAETRLAGSRWLPAVLRLPPD
jgi:ParB family chromosome partitioning protein